MLSAGSTKDRFQLRTLANAPWRIVLPVFKVAPVIKVAPLTFDFLMPIHFVINAGDNHYKRSNLEGYTLVIPCYGT